MSEAMWTQVDDYLSELLAPQDDALQKALDASAEAGLPAIQVSSSQGKLLRMLAQVQAADLILEIGTLGGYSTIWLARGLSADGLLITLESDPLRADVARRNIEAAGLSKTVEVRTGPALETLSLLESQVRSSFDLIFIDADKPTTPEYFYWAIRLSRPGSLIVVDNVVRKGEILSPSSTDPSVQGMRRFLAQLASESRVEATAIQTVGSKGYDGIVLARVID